MVLAALEIPCGIFGTQIETWMLEAGHCLPNDILRCWFSLSDAGGCLNGEEVSDVWQYILWVIELNEDMGTHAVGYCGGQREMIKSDRWHFPLKLLGSQTNEKVKISQNPI
jgi:hypothetical protein